MDGLNQDPILHFCSLFDNPFHLDLHQNTEEKICLYSRYIVLKDKKKSNPCDPKIPVWLHMVLVALTALSIYLSIQ